MSRSTKPANEESSRWRAFLICMLVSALTILDISKVNVAVPSVEASMGAGPTALQLITAGYALAYGIMLVPAGRLGDLYDRKTLLIIGVAGFTATSALCAFAPTLEVLVISRLLQGAAAGIQMPQAIGLIQQIFPPQERGRAFGYFGASVGVSAAVGPALGGLLIALGNGHDGWRSLFLLNVPVGAIALVLALRFLPRRPPNTTAHATRNSGLDVVGTLLLSVTTFTLMLPFVFTTGSPTDAPTRWLWLIVSAVALLSFVHWERAYLARGKSPLIRFALFQHRSFRSGVLIAAGYYAATPAIFLVTMIFLQSSLHLTPLHAGFAAVPFALMSALASSCIGRHISRWGRTLVTTGLVIALIALLLMTTFVRTASAESLPWLIVAALALAGAGSGMVTSANQTLTLDQVPVTEAGVAGSISQVAQRIGTAVGTSVIAAVFFAISADPLSRTENPNLVGAYLTALTIALIIMGVTALVSVYDLVAGRKRR